MAPRKPKAKSTQKARSSSGKVAKLKTPPKSDAQPRSYRMKRYKSGLLNLEKTPAHLIPIVQANANSPLLRLPAEIRNKIWEYTCGGQMIMLPKKWKTTEKGGAVDFPKKSNGTGRNIHRDVAIRKSSAFHLPEVCRQVYAETALTSYKANSFLCGVIDVTRTSPMARLMAAQRRAITTLEPDPWTVDYMVVLPDIDLVRIMRMWPNVRRVIITPEAMQVVQSGAGYDESLSDKATWNQEQWRAWVTERVERLQTSGVEWIFED